MTRREDAVDVLRELLRVGVKRVILAARTMPVPTYQNLLRGLIGILGAIATPRHQAAADVLRALIASGSTLPIHEVKIAGSGKTGVYIFSLLSRPSELPLRTYKPIPAPCIRSFKSIQFASCTLSETSSQRNSLFQFFHSSCAISVLPIASYAINLSILETANSIFGRWWSEMRTDELCTVINFVPAQFAEPFLQALRYTAGMLLNSPLSPNKDAETVAQAMVVLLNIFSDLVCQDA